MKRNRTRWCTSLFLFLMVLGVAGLYTLSQTDVMAQDAPAVAPAAEAPPADAKTPVAEAPPAAPAAELKPEAAAPAADLAPVAAEAKPEAAAPAAEAAPVAGDAKPADLPVAAEAKPEAAAPAAEAAPVAADAKTDAPTPATDTKPAAADAAPATEGKPAADPATAEAAPAPVKDLQPEEIDQNEKIRRAEIQLLAQGFKDAGNKAWSKNNYKEAIDNFKNAELNYKRVSKSRKDVIREIADVHSRMHEVNVDWAESLADEAEKFADAQKFDEAIEKCHAASELAPDTRSAMDARIKKYIDLKATANFRQNTAPFNVDPAKVERNFDVNVLFEQGKVLFNNQRYADARDKFEEILIKDPYDVRAVRYLRRIHKELGEVAIEKFTTTMSERIAEVRWKWSDPVSPVLSGGTAAPRTASVPKADSHSQLLKKLNDIKIPKIEFEEATVAQVVAFLKKRSQELDPDSEGVNIILQLESPNAPKGSEPPPAAAPEAGFPPAGGAEPAAAPEPPPADAPVPEAPAAPSGTSAGERTITMSMNNIPLGEVLRYVCMGAGLRFEIENNAVVIADKNIAIQDMETRFFTVKAGVFESKETKARLAGFKGADGEAAAAATDTGEGGATDPTNIRALFIGFGVEFPAGATVTYYQKGCKLIVKNTPKNMRKLEEVLQEINIPPNQVTIEAKFVEIEQTDVNALGFQWLLLNGDGNFNDGWVAGKDQASKLQVLKQGGASPFDASLTNGLRGIQGGISTPAADSVLGLNGVLGSMSFTTVIHALSQASTSDILSCPKVTVISGETATIKMVQERKFPDSWDPPTVNNSGGGNTGAATSVTPATPVFGETSEIGVILNVTPTVDSDNYTISLKLAPEVSAFIGYDTSFNTTMVLSGVAQPVQVIFNMPIIEKRTVDTTVMIWDGETVVLGGMIREEIQSYKDKVPLLGDVPLIGRLFQANGEKSVKKNLLIFVTARLVNPSGVPLRANDVRGLPDFRR